MTADKITGRMRLGATAQNKTVRKVLAGGGELLGVVKFSFLGIMLTLLGGLMLWAFLAGQFELQGSAIGVVLLLLGIWSLRTACRAYCNLRSISKA